MHTRFIELAGEINTFMPDYVLDKVINALNNHGKALSTSKILACGLSYKKNIDDARESPSFKLIEGLIKKRCTVMFSDPFFRVFPKTMHIDAEIPKVELNSVTLCEFDLVLIATDHDSFDYNLILKHSSLIVATRGRFSPSEKVIRA